MDIKPHCYLLKIEDEDFEVEADSPAQAMDRSVEFMRRHNKLLKSAYLSAVFGMMPMPPFANIVVANNKSRTSIITTG